MADASFLSWPFFEAHHRDHARRLDRWAAESLGAVDHHDVDARLSRAGRVARARRLARGHGAVARRSRRALDVRTLALSRETLARHDGLADFAFAMQGLGAGPISLFGSPEQRRTWLTRTRAGTAIAAFALTEADSGSDVAAIATTGRRDGDDWVLDGEKTWISNGGIADVYVVFARTGEAPGAKGLCAFVVPAATPGLSVAERLEVDRAASAGAAALRRLPAAVDRADRRARRRLQDRHGDARRVPRDGRRGGARLRASRARRSGGACADRGSASAPRWRSCRWCRGTSPTWRSTSTRRRCSSTAPPGRRTRARRASRARRRWRSSMPPRPRSA